MKSKSSSSKLIDNRVFWSMAVCAAIALSVLAFRIKNYEACTTVEIAVKQGPLYAGELIQFKAITNNHKIGMQWNFGDDSQPNKNGITVNHTFSTPGRYEILLNTESECSAFKTIYVLEAPKVEDEYLKPTFTGPLTVEVGEPAVFEDTTFNATKWEWRFGETNGVDATEQKVSYTFKNPGTKRVILIVNEHMQDELMVLVTPKEIGTPETVIKHHTPPARIQESVKLPEITLPQPITEVQEQETEEKEPVFPNVSIKQLENILTGIVEGKIAVADLSAYSCESQNMKVTYNGKWINLKKLQVELWEIKDPNKIKNLKIIVEKDPNRNCIKTMKISLKKKWL